MDYSKSGYIANLWGIQDSLLQSYRSVFITIESIFIAVSITIQGFKVPDPIFLAPVLIIGLYINKSWLEITSSRGLSVQFLQTMLFRHENQTDCSGNSITKLEPFQLLKKFQDDSSFRKQQMERGDFISGDSTRTALGSIIPLIFFAYWLFSAMYITIKHAPFSNSYQDIVQFYLWVSIVVLAAYLFVTLIWKLTKTSRNPEYEIPFFWVLFGLVVAFPGVVALLHLKLFDQLIC